MRLPLLSLALSASATLAAGDAPGTTRIARWKDDKACAYILMFDDSCQSHVKNVFPELKKRGLTGTFYVNPGSGQYAASRAAWEKDAPAAGFELADHTWTHKGGKTVADVEKEIVDALEAIHKATPALPWPRLVSYGQPGGIPKDNWPMSKDELKAVLAKNHLVDRPDFGGRGAMIAFKTGPEFIAHVDQAIAKKAMECTVFHGVGGDWITTPMPVFLEFLDGLEARKDKVWVTNHIPAVQYASERDAATATGAASGAGITVKLACTADPAFYDQPLTLVTAVPADWKACTVVQGKHQTEAVVADGAVRYDAVPGAEPIVLTRK